MSINACSINEHTINSLCGRRRQAIIDWLTPDKPATTGGGHPYHVRSNTDAQYYIRREQPTFTDDYESTHIQVAVEFMGQTYYQTIERDQLGDLAIVSVSRFKSTSDVEETVNISDIKIVRVS